MTQAIDTHVTCELPALMAATIFAVSSRDAVVGMGAELLPHAEYPQIGLSKIEIPMVRGGLLAHSQNHVGLPPGINPHVRPQCSPRWGRFFGKRITCPGFRKCSIRTTRLAMTG